MLALQDYIDKISKPSLVMGIQSGKLDSTFTDPECLEIILNDPWLTVALVERLKEIMK